ncbi:hypothetical protein [Sulfitobacter guttiformis]|uniref:hypothetical protein n=1 Tax=Sulfitobacter guttiformis TaxID=74349 RepID=UPI000566273A|nr:hypothetical protein [Sulfitobacter guttiformis]KIN73915.1 putative cytoplasmic protein [Sulfitobacter guttiformis KCTC 32187]
MAILGPDGHPSLFGVMPPVRPDRRMWAGGAFEFLIPLLVSEHLIRKKRIANVIEENMSD